MSETPDLFIARRAPFPQPDDGSRRRVAGGRLRPTLAVLRDALAEPAGVAAVKEAGREAWRIHHQQRGEDRDAQA